MHRFEFAHLLDPVHPTGLSDEVRIFADRELDALLGNPHTLGDDIDEVGQQPDASAPTANDDDVREPAVDASPRLRALAAEPTPLGEVDALLVGPASRNGEPITERVAIVPAAFADAEVLEAAPVEVVEVVEAAPVEVVEVVEVPEPEIIDDPVVVAAATSRFADAGLDDDRLPAARNRRTRRR